MKPGFAIALVIATGAVLALYSVAAPQDVQTQQHLKPPFSLTISIPRTVVKASTNVLIDVVLTNVSGHDPGISDCILQELNYHIEVSKEDGKSAQLTSFGHQLYVKPIDQSPLMSKMSRAVELLKPGQTVKPTLLASRVYDLSQSGVYKLQVERRIPFTDTFVKSNVITVTVTP